MSYILPIFIYKQIQTKDMSKSKKLHVFRCHMTSSLLNGIQKNLRIVVLFHKASGAIVGKFAYIFLSSSSQHK
uniref:Ovule protein n=1 Tax=Parascaris equorum TaxID=6256 RepID=A0A914RM27_PAREQ